MSKALKRKNRIKTRLAFNQLKALNALSECSWLNYNEVIVQSYEAVKKEMPDWLVDAHFNSISETIFETVIKALRKGKNINAKKIAGNDNNVTVNSVVIFATKLRELNDCTETSDIVTK